MIALVLAGVGLLLALVQTVALRRHLRSRPLEPRSTPFISILKPLCGFDDALWSNLRSFTRLRYPAYEIVLGVKDVHDSAFPIAMRAARKWPSLVRVVLQRGTPGLNPKVNQLITLAEAARAQILVISDSNVRVGRDYLLGVAAAFDDARVGLVTHPVAGVGERTCGALFDNMTMCGSIAAGIVSAKCIAGKDLVVGKSMAIRRTDLRAMGGLERLKDVLAEDFLCGRIVAAELGKRVALASRPVFNVSRSQRLVDFFSRYLRWSVMQRKAVGSAIYTLQILLNPLALATAAVLTSPNRWTAAALGAVSLARAALHESCARAIRGRGFSIFAVCAPIADLLVCAAWTAGLVRNQISWRGNRFRVHEGTRLERLPGAAIAEIGSQPATIP